MISVRFSGIPVKVPSMVYFWMMNGRYSEDPGRIHLSITKGVGGGGF